MIYRILTSALFAGFAAGLIAAVLQLLFVQPILLHAELFESGTLVYDATAGTPSFVERPAFNLQRDGLSILFSALVYTGYALMLVAAMAFASEQGHTTTPRQGIMWGIAGFITVHFAPAIGLSPELPGFSAADVSPRQVWWFSTVAVTGIGLWLLAFGTSWRAWGGAIVLLAAPHFIGAPEPQMFRGNTPPELAGLFATRALGVGLAVWACLGTLAAHFWTTEDRS